LRSGISRGTETLVFRGAVPLDQRDGMRAPFQEGDFPGPVKFGYLNVGALEEGPAELRGRTVFCDELVAAHRLWCEETPARQAPGNRAWPRLARLDWP
jgi:hypothetical protein